MSNAIEIATANEDGADGINEIVHWVDVSREVSPMRHRTHWSKKTTEEDEGHHDEPHYKYSLLHRFVIV